MEFNNFDSIRIGLASPEKIREWSYGEVKKPETINYRTLKPEKEGLFCEKIFGPTKDWECHCGKYKRIRFKGVICDKCGVEVTKASVRRERMGHIELAAPVSHIWYFRGIPSKMGILLNISPKNLEKVLYFASYIVLDEGDTTLMKYQILTEQEYAENRDVFGNRFKAGMGAEAIKELLLEIDLDELSEELREIIETSTGQKRSKAVRRLDVVESFRSSGNKPEWMILDVIPVIPPDLRPMVQLDGGRFAASDLNDLYRRVINRNNRLKKLLDLRAPEIIIKNEKRMLQEAVDSLVDNGRRGRPVTGPGKRPLKSLSDMLKGKQGRFRQNLLGKRVDYSGRSVIVVGPELKFYQCGLPKKMALELYKPFVMRRLMTYDKASHVRSAKRMVEKEHPEVWDVVEEVIKEHPVLLNRAPTLHRLGIQAFEPVLVEGKAIKLHPLVCTAYNADFDGDQMAVHVPLSVEAQSEARFLMLSSNNILAPKDGKPITTPTQDMVMGCYYLTLHKEDALGQGKFFSSFDEMIMALENNLVDLHAMVNVKMTNDKGSSIIESTVGRFIFNSKIPQDIGLVDRKKEPFALEVDQLCTQKVLEYIIGHTYETKGSHVTAQMLDNIKDLGFKYSTKSAISISMADMVIPPQKSELIEKTKILEDKYIDFYKKGMISDDERHEFVIKIWGDTKDDIKNAVINNLGTMNSLYIMSQSGARGNANQISQICGIRGNMASATGKTVEVPILGSLREGLSILEYFISTTGARKGSADTALRTADSGYLTRRLVDVAQDVIVRVEDCGTSEGVELVAIKEGNEVIENLTDRILGRYPAEDIKTKRGRLICDKNTMINSAIARDIEESGLTKVKVRSVLSCECEGGVCAKCYGINLADGRSVSVGEAVGTIAAQSIGEPGTQLTMRTFHTGGVAGADITQGLPRVEEVFEARKPKGLALMAKEAGTLNIFEEGRRKEIHITTEDGSVDKYQVVYGSKIRFKEGSFVEKGEQLTDGSLYPTEIISITGVEGVENYIVKEVQRVYVSQGVAINDKHIEIIAKQMLSKIRIIDSGDTEFIPGNNEDYQRFVRINKEMEAQGLRPATGERIVLGITKASLSTDSFLSAASFQETTRVLTDAAIRGKEDRLVGLKENVIIGKLIPAGTGINRYRYIETSPNE
ncbi:MAG: DNA-directed RNA polymerase subunit beta' [Tissierellia bacterium]|nr:DNA-directed RNA polymerase subunit beta' [Tissierellia bacterium]